MNLTVMLRNSCGLQLLRYELDRENIDAWALLIESSSFLRCPNVFSSLLRPAANDLSPTSSSSTAAFYASFVAPPNNPRPFRWNAPRTDKDVDASIAASKDMASLAKSIEGLKFLMPSTIAALLGKLTALERGHAERHHEPGFHWPLNQGLTAAEQLRERALREADVYLHMMDAGQLVEVLHAVTAVPQALSLAENAAVEQGSAAAPVGESPHNLVGRILDILSHDGGRAVLMHGGAPALAQLAKSIESLSQGGVGEGAVDAALQQRLVRASQALAAIAK